MKKVFLFIMQPQRKMYLRTCSMVHGWKQSYVFLHVTLLTPSFDLLYLLNITTSYLEIYTEYFLPSLCTDLSILSQTFLYYLNFSSFPCFSDLLESLTNYSWDQGQNQLNITTEIMSSGTLVKLLNNPFFRVQISIAWVFSYLMPS